MSTSGISQESRPRCPPLSDYLLSLLLFALFFGTNYIFNHQHQWINWLPTKPTAYFFAIFLPFGIVLPSVALGWLIRRKGGRARAFGATLRPIDWAMMLVALAAGFLFASFPIGRKVVQDPNGLANVLRLFIWLLMVSLAEVLVFIGLVFHVIERGVHYRVAGRRGKITGAVCAIIISAVAFGLFHFSDAAPWNTRGQVALLILVWLGVAVFYTLTRSLAAAVVFYNMMAITGFVLNDLRIPVPASVGLVLDGIAVAVTIGIVALVGLYRPQVVGRVPTSHSG